MDTRQIEYILKIADEKNITRAAEKLFITQSALSQQLQKVEKELDTRLFVRSRSEWLPTPEGRVYLSSAREILRIKQKAYTIIGDMSNSRKGFLSIGLTPGRGPDMFTHVYPDFHTDFPDITVDPRELSVRAQQELIRKGELDIGFVTLTPNQKTRDEHIELLREELYIAVPEQYPVPEIYLQHQNPEEPYATLPLEALQYEPFVLMYRNSTVRELVDQIFRDAGFQPSVLFETSSNATILSMIRSRLCCGIIPYYYVRQKPAGVRFFRLPFRPQWSVYAFYQRDSYLTSPARAFIELARKYWTDPDPWGLLH